MAEEQTSPRERAIGIIDDAERRGQPCPPTESKAWRVAQWVSIVFAIAVAAIGFVFGAGSFVTKASAAQAEIEQHAKRDEVQDALLTTKADKTDLDKKADKSVIEAMQDDIRETRSDVKEILKRMPAR